MYQSAMLVVTETINGIRVIAETEACGLPTCAASPISSKLIGTQLRCVHVSLDLNFTHSAIADRRSPRCHAPQGALLAAVWGSI